MKTWSGIVLMLMISGGVACGGVVYVSPGGDDLKPGLTPADAVRSIPVGLQRAAQYGLSAIHVEEGLYAPGAGLNLAGSGVFISQSGIILSGGWQSGFQTRHGRSVLVGQSLLTHIVTAWGVRDIGMEGFTLMDGRADGVGCSPDAVGGGMLWVGVTNGWMYDCTITECQARDAGGGMAVYYSDDNQIEVELTGNFCTNGFGGGLYLASSKNNGLGITAMNNQGYYGGGVFLSRGARNDLNLDVRHNMAVAGGGVAGQYARDTVLLGRLHENQALIRGGGVWLDRTTNVYIEGDIRFNRAGSNTGYPPCNREGGGLFLSIDSQTTLHGVLWGNQADTAGGALYSFASEDLIVNTEVVSNRASCGGGLYVAKAENVSVESCWIEGNIASSASAIFMSMGFGSCFVRDCSIINNDVPAPPMPGSVILIEGPDCPHPPCPYYGVAVLEDNVIGGSSHLVHGVAYMTALAESTATGISDLTGHVLRNNLFMMPHLQWLYSDFSNGQTRNFRVLNKPSYSSAASVSGNAPF